MDGWICVANDLNCNGENKLKIKLQNFKEEKKKRNTNL